MQRAAERLIRRVVAEGAVRIGAFNRRRLPMPERPHPFLNGMHAPVRAEVTLTDLAVTGTIPPQLDGTYLRIGPNPVAGDPKTYHWFLGDGMVHGVRLKGGRAPWYRNRWIRSHHVGEALGVPVAPGPRNGTFDTVNTNVIGHAGSTFALVEAGSTPVRLDDDLDGQSYDDFGGTLGGSFTAHPHLDPLSGELHAIAYNAREPERIRHLVVGRDGTVRRKLDIPVQHGPSIHDCAVTGRYVVILDLPVTFSIGALMAGHSFPYRWNPSHRARVGLLPREGAAADIVWIDVDPCYIFHTANAFDLPDGRVVLDAVVYDRMFAGHSPGPNAAPRGFERWTLDPGARTVARRVLDPAPQEFPRPDERRIGQPYRYAYALGLPDEMTPDLVVGTYIYKHDIDAGTRQRHEFGPGRHPGEFVFVPRGPGEDEGWLVGYVIDTGAGGATDLVILDAADFEGAPVASVHIPARVPAGFHGNWIASADAAGADVASADMASADMAGADPAGA